MIDTTTLSDDLFTKEAFTALIERLIERWTANEFDDRLDHEETLTSEEEQAVLDEYVPDDSEEYAEWEALDTLFARYLAAANNCCLRAPVFVAILKQLGSRERIAECTREATRAA